jgi:hypothetical protein
MAQSILAWLDPRQTTSDPFGLAPPEEVLAPDLLQDVADTLARIDRIVAARQLANDHDGPVSAPTLDERDRLPWLARLGARAPGKDAVARITAE